MNVVWLSAAGLCGATIIGAILGFLIKDLPHRWNDTILGFCAGIMLSACTVGLIEPAFEMTMDSGITLGWLWVSIGVVAGALFLNLLDVITPHMHTITGLDPEEHKSNHRLNGVLLFVMAIAIHKLPEGMAAGVTMNQDVSGSIDWAVTIGISIQNIPEGMVIIAPLLMAGITPIRTIIISLVIGLLEVIGVWIGYALGSISAGLLPIMLGFAGGAMLYVTSDEMIPETHTHGYQKQATYALLVGFVTLILAEKLL